MYREPLNQSKVLGQVSDTTASKKAGITTFAKTKPDSAKWEVDPLVAGNYDLNVASKHSSYRRHAERRGAQRLNSSSVRQAACSRYTTQCCT